MEGERERQVGNWGFPAELNSQIATILLANERQKVKIEEGVWDRTSDQGVSCRLLSGSQTHFASTLNLARFDRVWK